MITFCIITIRIFSLTHAGGDGLQRDGTLQTLPLHFTGHLIGQTYVTIHQQVGGGAAAAAIEARPALPAGGTGVDVLFGKLAGDVHVEGAVKHIPHAVLLLPHKLVAGVDVSVWSDGHILTARSAAPKALDDTGALGQVHIEVEEVHVLPAHELLGQFFVLRLHLLQIPPP